LSLHGMHRDERQLAAPSIAIDRGASVGCLMVDDLTCRNGTGDSLPIISNNGHIGRLVAANLHGVAGSGPIALFDLTASGVIGSREIGTCDGMDVTGAICADLPDFLQAREGVAMSD